MRIGLGLGIGFVRAGGTPSPQPTWVIDGSEVQQAPNGPTVIWTVSGSNISYTEV